MMKTALIFFKSTNKALPAEYFSSISACFENAGIDISSLAVLSENDDLSFKRRLTEFRDTADNLIVFESQNLSFDLKEIVSDVFDAPMVENDTARKFLDAVSAQDGVEYADTFALMPLDATIVPNVKGAYQGFILDDNSFTLALLPNNIEQLKPMCEKYVLPYFENKSGKKIKRLVLKYFGDKTILEEVVDSAKKIGDFEYAVTELNGDITLDLNFGDGGNSSQDVIRKIVGELKENIYAEFDTTLGERLFDLLKLKNIKLSVAESFTAGRVVSSVIANSGASAYVHEGVVSYSNDSKESRLGVQKADLIKEGAVSSIVAYQMCAGLLRTGKCDLAIATTGIAGPKSDDTKKPVGLCYIAVGMKDGVHTYRYVIPGNREQITETAKNTALFLAIKKLKNK